MEPNILKNAIESAYLLFLIHASADPAFAVIQKKPVSDFRVYEEPPTMAVFQHADSVLNVDQSNLLQILWRFLACPTSSL
jgi:hypothetical protein